MSDSEQMELDFPKVCTMHEQWPVLLELVRQVAVDVGRKQIGGDLKMGRSVLDNTLLDRDRHSLKAKHLIYYLLSDESGRMIRLLANLCGQQVLPRKPLTPEEKLRALEATVRRRLGDLGDEILAEAAREVG